MSLLYCKSTWLGPPRWLPPSVVFTTSPQLVFFLFFSLSPNRLISNLHLFNQMFFNHTNPRLPTSRLLQPGALLLLGCFFCRALTRRCDCAVSRCIAPAVSASCMELCHGCLTVRLSACLSVSMHALTRRCLPDHFCFLTDMFVSLSLSCLQLLYPILGIYIYFFFLGGLSF